MRVLNSVQYAGSHKLRQAADFGNEYVGFSRGLFVAQSSLNLSVVLFPMLGVGLLVLRCFKSAFLLSRVSCAPHTPPTYPPTPPPPPTLAWVFGCAFGCATPPEGRTLNPRLRARNAMSGADEGFDAPRAPPPPPPPILFQLEWFEGENKNLRLAN